jgi:hypothetical protein
MLETLIVIAIVVAAGLWVGWRIWRRATGRGRSSCGNCPGCKPAGDSPPADGDEHCRTRHDSHARKQG